MSSFAGGNAIVGMPALRAERCDDSVVRLMLILGSLNGGTGAARALQESPLAEREGGNVRQRHQAQPGRR